MHSFHLGLDSTSPLKNYSVVIPACEKHYSTEIVVDSDC